ncbi:MAG: hypothetical protein ACREEY_07860 [Brevundimonas sp.]
MGGGTTIASQIERLVSRLDGAGVCDDCITERLDLSVRSQANFVTRGLGGQRGYERIKDACTPCARVKTVIRYRTK